MKTLRISFISFLCLIVSACGFHMRSLKSLPPRLHTLYYTSTNSNIDLNALLKAQFASLGVDMVKSPSSKAITLSISNYNFSHNQPSITTSNQAITYDYTLSFNYALKNQYGQNLMATKSISINSQQVMNANQIYTSSAGPLIESRMQKDAAALLFDELTSNDTKAALASGKTRA